MRHTQVVIPCFNEAQRLDPDAFRRAVDHDPDLCLLLVDDGSTDDTLTMLKQLAADRPGAIDVLGLEANQGKAEAVRRGIVSLLDKGELSAKSSVGYWDADLATPLEVIADFRVVLQQDPNRILVMGARVQLLGRSIERKTSRHYLGRVFATVAARTLRMRVYDTQCGAKLFRANDIVKRAFAEPFDSRWVFDVELLARLRIACGDTDTPAPSRIYEFPLDAWHDVAGSKVRPRDFLRAIGELWSIRRRYGKGCRSAARKK